MHRKFHKWDSDWFYLSWSWGRSRFGYHRRAIGRRSLGFSAGLGIAVVNFVPKDRVKS